MVAHLAKRVIAEALAAVAQERARAGTLGTCLQERTHHVVCEQPACAPLVCQLVPEPSGARASRPRRGTVAAKPHARQADDVVPSGSRASMANHETNTMWDAPDIVPFDQLYGGPSRGRMAYTRLRLSRARRGATDVAERGHAFSACGQVSSSVETWKSPPPASSERRLVS
jgi:hypothetical protein